MRLCRAGSQVVFSALAIARIVLASHPEYFDTWIRTASHPSAGIAGAVIGTASGTGAAILTLQLQRLQPAQ